ncbi:MAG TPA: YbhB/YbcL family Raf kinase inhibitor-like protein [Steroidobacteraceae bacterium]
MLEKLPEFVGHALQERRAGLESILSNKIALTGAVYKLEVLSPAFPPNGLLPARFTADGEAVAPPLQWGRIPDATANLVLIVEDADSPTAEPLVHAIAVDIDPHRVGIAEGELTAPADELALKLGRNSYLRQGWLPPDPPPGHGVHRYAFQLFALKEGKPFSDAPGRRELAEAIRERALAAGCLIGTYERTGARNTRPHGELPAGSEDLHRLQPEVPKVGSTDAPGG